MADLTFTRQQIDELTERLGSLAADLGEPQRRLLLAIFAAGVDKVESDLNDKSGAPPAPKASGGPQKAEGAEAPDAGKLRDQLRKSFVPGGPRPIVPGGPRPAAGGLVIRVTPH
jgi:hypothetical protein